MTHRRYSPIGHTHEVAAGDHGALTGLADDDHTQYHTDARGDARYSPLGHTHDYLPLAGGTVSGHINYQDPAGTASAMNRWLSFRDGALFERGWLGFGYGTTHFGIVNTIGELQLTGTNILLNGRNALTELDNTVKLTGNQTIAGEKEFAQPSGSTYVYINALAASQSAIGFRSAGSQTAVIYRPGNSTDLRFYQNGLDAITIANNAVTVHRDLSVGTDIVASGGGYIVGNLSGGALGVINTSSSTGKGLSLYNGAQAGMPEYGITFTGTAVGGTYGPVTADWATYFTMDNTSGRGWVFRNGSGPVAAISNAGHARFAGDMGLGRDLVAGKGSIALNGGLISYGNNGSASVFDGTLAWGTLTIQGRVLSSSGNIHLSPPNGSRVEIDTNYRAAGGSVGVAGLYLSGVIDIGHVSDTTLSRLSAGQLGVAGKAALQHAGAFTSGKVTISTSAPSGGANGDIWLKV